MATEKQIEANRRNAQKSTGPRTEEGKARCKMNALTHGLRAEAVLLPYENREEFDALRAELKAEWNPQTQAERILLEQMVASQWKLLRLEGIEHDVCTVGKPRKLKRDLNQLWPQESRLENTFHRAMRELGKLQKARQEQSRAESAASIDSHPVVNKAPMAPIVQTPQTPPPAPYIVSAEPPSGHTCNVSLLSRTSVVTGNHPESLREEGKLE